jgi:hypothetical protein
MSEIETIVINSQLRSKIKAMIILGFIVGITSMIGFTFLLYDLLYFLNQYQKGKVEMFWYRWLNVPMVCINFIAIIVWIKLTFNLHYRFQKEKKLITSKIIDTFMMWQVLGIINTLIHIVYMTSLFRLHPFYNAS